MKGFLKRDWALLCLNLRFYVLCLLVFCVMSIFAKMSSGFTSTYVIILAASCVISLFSYDEANRWQGYAAAVSNGRNAMVDARYTLAVCLGLGLIALQFVLGRLGREALTLALMYGGMFFIYIAITLPVFYRFGSVVSRIILICTIALIAGVVGAVSAMLTFQSVQSDRFPGMPTVLLALGVIAIAVSWPISRKIVEKKEF